MTNEDKLLIQKAMLDPASLQMEAMRKLDNALDGKFDIVDPNNPFMYLMENTTLLTSSMFGNVEMAIRKQYPVLANDKNDLYHHINDTEINNVISTPSEAIFNIFFNLNDLIRNGVETQLSFETMIPKYSFINVNDTTFTILNDIVIRYYKNGSCYAEILFDELDLAVNINKTIESSLVTNNDGVDLVLISLPVKQVKKYDVSETLLLKQPFIKDVVINDYFTYLRATTLSTSLGRVVELNKTFSEFVYDPLTPSILIKPMDNLLRLEVPSVYILNNSITSFVNLEIYTTKGEIELELNNYDTNEFELTFNIDSDTSDSGNTITAINCNITASTDTYGGRNEVSFEELKGKIINYATGDNKLPVTLQEVDDLVTSKGFNFLFVTDTIVKREFVINKYIGNLGFNVMSNIDLFISKIKIDMVNINSSKIKLVNDCILISPYQRYKLVDGTMVPISDVDETVLTNLISNDLATYNTEKYFFNPYLYILDYKDKLKTRVYDITTPVLDNVKSLFNNSTSTPFIVTNREVIRTSDSVIVRIYLDGNNSLLTGDALGLYGQLDIYVDSVSTIKYESYLKFDDYDGFYIETLIPIVDFIDSDNRVLLNNGLDDLTTSLVPINTNAVFFIYTTGEIDGNVLGYDTVEIVNDEATSILYIEGFDLALATSVDNLYRNYNVNFKDRKFKTYDDDVYLRYSKDVYETDEDGTIKLVTDEDGNVELVLKHDAGSIVMDGDEQVILHRAGDIMLDDNDEPIIDFIDGTVHNIDVLLLEDCFARATELEYRDYLLEHSKTVGDILEFEIPELNNSLLENTLFKYGSGNEVGDVLLILDNEWKAFDNFITPSLTINVLRGTNFVIDDNVTTRLALTLQNILSNSFILSVAEDELKSVIGDDVVSVRLSGIINIEVSSIVYKDGSSRFILNKKLIKNDDGNTVVVSDLKINLVTI